MSDEMTKLFIPFVDERQWCALGSLVADGAAWMIGLFGTLEPTSGPVRPVELEGLKLTNLEKTLRKSSRARRALKILLEELEEPSPSSQEKEPD